MSIAQCITQASRPRSIMCPIPFGIRVELDNAFGSKWLVNHLSRLGFSASYDEALRYKESDVASLQAEGQNESNNFIQWVADNVDHNTATLTGQGIFHGMGIISIMQPGKSLNRISITCLKYKQKTAETIQNKGIELHQFLGSYNDGLMRHTLIPNRQLGHPFTMPNEIDFNTLWHAG